MFAADGSQEHDIRRRIDIAQTRAGQLRHVLGNKLIDLNTRLRLYNAAVGSLLTYDSEAWTLTPKTLRMLNGANSRMLSHFTGKSVHDEARDSTTSYNLNLQIRKRRLRWLGHILRLGQHRLIRKAVEEQLAMGTGGNLLMDAPKGCTINELTTLANMDNNQTWRKMVKSLC